MPRYLFLLLLVMVISLFSFGQPQKKPVDALLTYRHAEKLYHSPQATEQSDSAALRLYLKVISLLSDQSSDPMILFDSYLKSAILEMSNIEDQSSLNHLNLAIALKKNSPLLADSLLFQPYLFAGSAYYNLNNLDSAQFCYRQAESLLSRYPELAESERLYNKSGALFYETGDYRKSIQYFQKALSVAENRRPVNPFFIVNYKNNIASALRKMHSYDQAMEIYKGLLAYHINRNELFHNIGATYLSTGRFSEAIQWLRQVEYASQTKLNDIGNAYLQMKQPDSAHVYLVAAKTAYEKTGNHQKNLDYAITLKYLADLMMQESKPETALGYYQNAIIQLDQDFNDPSIRKNPEQFVGLYNSFFLFNTLVAKAEAFHLMAGQTKNPDKLLDAYSTYGSAILLAKQVSGTFNSDEARFFLENSTEPVTRTLVGIGLELFDRTKNRNYLDQTFAYVENSKAAVLQAELHQLSLDSVRGMPQDQIREEKRLKASITKMNIRLSGITDSSAKTITQKNILDAEINLSSLQQKLEENPAYRQLKMDSRKISVDSIQQYHLGGDEAVISYYFLPTRLICFYLTKSQFGYVSTGANPQLVENIRMIRNELSRENSQDNRFIVETSKKLFKTLLEPVFDKIRDKTHWLIIPHNEISYLPFEMLIDPQNQELLLRHFAMSYGYSANFIGETVGRTKSTYGVLGMAPFAKDSSSEGLSALKASAGEIKDLPGKTMIGKEASKQNFMGIYTQYPVIHLATHAIANDADPLQSFIAFYGQNKNSDTLDRLYEPEIYQLDMQSNRLVILSACETGNGQLVNGEGVMSLARAFSYAGCKSAIASLWKADDQASAYISHRLHDYLQRGMRKDEALQKAKSDYLDNPDIDASKKTPAYWAQLVLIGDTEPIIKKNSLVFWLIGLVLILVILGWIIKKNRAGH